MRFAERLRELRIGKNLSQREMEKHFNLGMGVVSKWEVGKNEPSLTMLVSLVKYFEVSAGYLLGIED